MYLLGPKWLRAPWDLRRVLPRRATLVVPSKLLVKILINSFLLLFKQDIPLRMPFHVYRNTIIYYPYKECLLIAQTCPKWLHSFLQFEIEEWWENTERKQRTPNIDNSEERYGVGREHRGSFKLQRGLAISAPRNLRVSVQTKRVIYVRVASASLRVSCNSVHPGSREG